MPIVEVGSVAEAVAALSADPESRRLIGGGTGLMLMARSGFFAPESLVTLRRATDIELHDVRVLGGCLRIGALVTLRDLELDPTVRRVLPTLPGVLHRVSSVRTRNVATVAGCLAHADPKMDLPTYLMALGALLVVETPTGRREIRLDDFFVGYYQTALEPTDVIVAVEVPVRRSGQYTDYRKFTGTLVEDWPLVSLCVDLHEGAGSISQAAVTVGALGATICRLPAVEEWLHGRTRDEVELGLDDLRATAQSHVQAKDDHLASADYKRKVFAAELGRALRGWIAATGMEVDR